MSGHLWKTKEGKAIPLEQMSDKHLTNTIAFLSRFEAKMDADAWAAACYSASTSAEMASDAADEASAEMLEAANDARGWRVLMQDEQKRRGAR